MFYKCLYGFMYGFECSLVCRGKFFLVGNEIIVCEKNFILVLIKGYWEKGDIEFFCKCKIYKIYVCLNFFFIIIWFIFLLIYWLIKIMLI